MTVTGNGYCGTYTYIVSLYWASSSSVRPELVGGDWSLPRNLARKARMAEKIILRLSIAIRVLYNLVACARCIRNTENYVIYTK